MNIIPFRPSNKYVLLQLAPYFLLIAANLSLSWLWRSSLLDLIALLLILITCRQMTVYCSELYILTEHGLILCRGLFNKRIYWRTLTDFNQMRREQPGLQSRFDLFNLRLGVSGPPADRITLYGIDLYVLRLVMAEIAKELKIQQHLYGGQGT